MNPPLPPGAAWYPQYLPYPHAIPMSHGPFPNATAIRFPQGQFSPEFLPHSSFQPYNWNKHYKVIYSGGGNPYMTKTPRTQYGAMAPGKAPCACSNPAFGELDYDDPELNKHSWKMVALGMIAGAVLTHTYLKAKDEVIDD